jgi:thymidylate synthase
MRVINIDTAADYGYVVRRVLAEGHPRTARGKKTIDLGVTAVSLADPMNALPIGIGRGLNTGIAAYEAASLIAGTTNYPLLLSIAPNFKQFMDPVGHSGTQYFHGAYGNRIGTQLSAVVQKLTRDRGTRQAVITLWDPRLDNLRDRSDYPCTIALAYELIGEYLNATTFMRSNDVWWGFPYDIFQFTQLQMTIANCLKVFPGEYTHITQSLHLYDEHQAAARHFVDTALPYNHDKDQPHGFGGWGMTVQDVMHGAWSALTNSESPKVVVPGEGWYRDKLWNRAPKLG